MYLNKCHYVEFKCTKNKYTNSAILYIYILVYLFIPIFSTLLELYCKVQVGVLKKCAEFQILIVIIFSVLMERVLIFKSFVIHYWYALLKCALMSLHWKCV